MILMFSVAQNGAWKRPKSVATIDMMGWNSSWKMQMGSFTGEE
jgi:hypothetical protein